MPLDGGTVNQNVAAANGQATYLGTIVATTTKNNHTTATPFNNTGDALRAMWLTVQPDTACYILCGTTNAATVTTSNGLLIEANEKYTFKVRGSAAQWLAAVAVSGTSNLKVWEVAAGN